MMRIFLDTEFTGLHQHTSLISIGLAADNGDIFYAERNDFDKAQLDDWVNDNVLPHLSGDLPAVATLIPSSEMVGCGNASEVEKALRLWLERFGEKNSVEIWADVLAWDWVLLCNLMGGAFGLPEQIHYIPRDLSTLMVIRGIDPDTPREELGKVAWSHPKLKLTKHHALYDALLEKDIFEKIY